MTVDPHAVSAEELRQIVERIEAMNEEIEDFTAQRGGVYDEAKGCGYDTKVLRKIVALRKLKPDDLAEQEAVLDVYRQALGL